MPYRSDVMPAETPNPFERDHPTSTYVESAHHPGFGGSGEVVLAGHRGVLARQISHGIPRMVSRRSTTPGTNEAPHKAVSRRGTSPYGFGAGTRWTTLREFGTTPGTGRTRRYAGSVIQPTFVSVTAVSLPWWQGPVRSPGRTTGPVRRVRRGREVRCRRRPPVLARSARPPNPSRLVSRGLARVRFSQLRGGRPRRRNAGAGGVRRHGHGRGSRPLDVWGWGASRVRYGR